MSCDVGQLDDGDVPRTWMLNQQCGYERFLCSITIDQYLLILHLLAYLQALPVLSRQPGCPCSTVPCSVPETSVPRVFIDKTKKSQCEWKASCFQSNVEISFYRVAISCLQCAISEFRLQEPCHSDIPLGFPALKGTSIPILTDKFSRFRRFSK